MKRGYKISLYTLAGVWLATMLVLLPKFISLHKETLNVERVFDQYSAALVGGNFVEAYQLCGQDFQKATSYNEFVMVQTDLQTKYGKLKSVRQKAHDISGSGNPMQWQAVIDGNFAYEKRNVTFKFLLHKEADHWVIFGVEQL